MLPEEPTPQQEAAVKCGVDWCCQWVFLGKSSGVQISGGLPDKLESHDSRGPIGGVGTRKSREVTVLGMWRELLTYSKSVYNLDLTDPVLCRSEIFPIWTQADLPMSLASHLSCRSHRSHRRLDQNQVDKGTSHSSPAIPVDAASKGLGNTN
jgi:hypothetical protein